MVHCPWSCDLAPVSQFRSTSHSSGCSLGEGGTPQPLNISTSQPLCLFRRKLDNTNSTLLSPRLHGPRHVSVVFTCLAFRASIFFANGRSRLGDSVSPSVVSVSVPSLLLSTTQLLRQPLNFPRSEFQFSACPRLFNWALDVRRWAFSDCFLSTSQHLNPSTSPPTTKYSCIRRCRRTYWFR
jgi:hypothetical protein